MLRLVVALMMTAFVATGCQKKPRLADEEVTTEEEKTAEQSQTEEEPASE